MLLVAFCMSQQAHAQFTKGLHEVSVSFSNTKMGLPFIMLFPMHPGVEASATFLKKEKEKSTQRVKGHLGYFHHSVLVTAPYLKATYAYQRKIKNTIGLDAHFGIGYSHAFYPGDGYIFNETSKQFESKQINQGFFLTNLGLGVSYIKPKKISPFLKYNFNFLGFSLDYRYLLSNVHVGVNYHFNNNQK